MSAKPTPKAFSYLRFSTPEQASGDSERRQIERARAWAKQRGISLDESFRDLGVSAHQGKHRKEGALAAFLALVVAGKIARGSFLVVENQDRLSRENPLEALELLARLVRSGVTIVDLSQGGREITEKNLSSDPAVLFTVVASAIRAHDESQRKSERVGAAWRRKKEIARETKKPLTSRCPGWLELRSGEFQPIPERVKVIKRIFAETIKGRGRRDIVAGLNRDKIPSFRPRKESAGAWSTSSVAKIVSGRMVLGEYLPHEGTHRQRNRKPVGDPIPDFYPAVVDEATFYKAQKAIADRKVSRVAGRRGAFVPNLMQGLGRCAHCGSPMYLLNKGEPPKGGKYFACRDYRRNAGCDNDKLFRVEKIEAALLRWLEYIAHEDIISDSATAPEEAEILVLSEKLEAARKRAARLLAIVEDDPDDDMAAMRYRQAQGNVKELRAELAARKNAQSQKDASGGVVVRLGAAATLVEKMRAAKDTDKAVLRVELAQVVRSLLTAVSFDREGRVKATMQVDRVRRPGVGRLKGAPFVFRVDALKEDDKVTRVLTVDLTWSTSSESMDEEVFYQQWTKWQLAKAKRLAQGGNEKK